MEQLNELLKTIGLTTGDVTGALLGLAKAVVVLIVGFWIVKRIVNLVGRGLQARDMEAGLQTFLKDLVSVLLKVLVIISAASMVGIETTSFVAILGAAGLAVGLALQGSLSNFAGGVMILLFKPFKIGDLIEGEGHTGVVKAINIFVTTMTTPDNKTVVIPNGALSNGSITNYSTLDLLRVDLVIGIGYGEDIGKARDVIMEVMMNDPKVLKDPAPSVNVLELADSSVNLAVRPYSTVANYWDVYFGTQEKAKIALDKAGIEIPFPQQVNHQA
ncbi:MAG: mechanosensitive ion channel domain-containing protein [Bacteroidota bacterium]